MDVEFLFPHSELVFGLLGGEHEGADHGSSEHSVKKYLLIHNLNNIQKYKFLPLKTLIYPHFFS